MKALCCLAAGLVACSGTAEHSTSPVVDRSREEAIEVALRARSELMLTGVLYPADDQFPDGAYGGLARRPSIVRFVGDGWWHVAFAFRCPHDPHRGRVFRVHGDGAWLSPRPVMLPSLEPIVDPEPRIVDDAAHPGAVGLWTAEGGDPFFYDGTSVCISLWERHFVSWTPESGVYRVACEWSGDVLRIHYPRGVLEDSVRFRDGRFEELTDDGGIAVVYERVPLPVDLESGFLPLVLPRPHHVYGGRQDAPCE